MKTSLSALAALIFATTACRYTMQTHSSQSHSESKCDENVEGTSEASFMENVSGNSIKVRYLGCVNFETQAMRVVSFAVEGLVDVNDGQAAELAADAAMLSFGTFEATHRDKKIHLVSSTQIGALDNDALQAEMWSGKYFGDARLSIKDSMGTQDFFLRTSPPSDPASPCNAQFPHLYKTRYSSAGVNPRFTVDVDFCSIVFLAGGTAVWVTKLRVKDADRGEWLFDGHTNLAYMESHHNDLDTVRVIGDGTTYEVMVGRQTKTSGRAWISLRTESGEPERFSLMTTEYHWF